MPRVPDLIGRIRLDTRDLDRAKGEVRSFGSQVDGLGGKIGQGLSSGLDEATTALTAGFGVAGAQAKSTLDRLGTSALASGSALQFGLGAGAVAGGLLLAKFATDGVDAFLSLAEQVRDFQRAAGGSAEDASRFIAVFDDLQISAELGASAVFKLGREIDAGAPKLRKYGVEVANNADGTANLTETLLNVADAYAAAPDQATRTGIAFAAFGRQAIGLIPLLEKGRVGLEDFFASAEDHGQILSEEDKAEAEALRLAIDELNDAMRGLQLIGAKALIPFITKLADAAAKVAEFTGKVERITGGALGKIATAVATELLGPVGDVAQGLSLVESGGDKTSDSLDGVNASAAGAAGGLEGLGGELDRVANSSTAGIAGLSATQKILDGFAKALANRRTATISAAEAQGSDRRAMQFFGEAVSDVEAKERALVLARQRRTDASRDAITAERALNSVEDAESSVLDRERELARAREGRGPKAKELADAERDLARARQEVGAARGLNALAQANERVAEAEDRLRTAREEGGQEADVADATESLSRAKLDAKDATLSLGEAQQRQAAAQAAGTDEVSRAERDALLARENAISAAVSSAKAAQEVAEQLALADGKVLSSGESYGVFRERLISLRDSLPATSEVRGAIEGLLTTVREMPEVRPIMFEANVGPAIGPLSGLIGQVSSLRRDAENALVFSADVSQPTAALTGLKGLVDRIRQDTENVLAGLSFTPPPTLAANRTTAPLTATSTPLASTTTNITNNVVALGANADIARDLATRQARDAARAR